MMNEMMLPQTSMSQSQSVPQTQPPAQQPQAQPQFGAFDNSEALKNWSTAAASMQAMYWPAAYQNQLAQFSQFTGMPHHQNMNMNMHPNSMNMLQQQQPQSCDQTQEDIKQHPLSLLPCTTQQQQLQQHDMSVNSTSSSSSVASDAVSPMPCSPLTEHNNNTSGSVCDVSPSSVDHCPPSMVTQSGLNPAAFNAFHHTPTSAQQLSTIMMNKKKANPVPGHMKDSVYWERRKRNNDSAKRSREGRRQKEEQIAMKAVYQEQEIMALRAENVMLRQELERMQMLMYNGVNAAALGVAAAANQVQ
jgi:hypothetical protein